MTTEETTKLLLELRNANCGDETLAKVLQAATDSVTLSALQRLLPQTATAEQNKTKQKTPRNCLKFTNKEISKIPMAYKNIFVTDDKIVHYRRKKNGVFEARFNRCGLHIEVSSKDLSELKEKFIEKLKGQAVVKPVKAKKPAPAVRQSKTFREFAEEWLYVKRTLVKPTTCKEYERMLTTDILPVFGDKIAAEISREELQGFLLKYVNVEKFRTASKLHLLLRCIFDVVAEDEAIPSPMKKVVVPSYESKKGSAFTYEEEKILVNHCLANLDKDTSHALLVLIYTGLRRSELASIEIIDGKWLQCDTSKERMGKNVVKRKIPFTPMMKRVAPFIDFERAKRTNLNSLHTAIKRLLPQHHLHELRYTFITRCKESNVPGELVLLWDGHEEDKSLHSSKVDRGYTDYSDAYQLKQAAKVDYLKWDFPIAV